MKKRIGSALLGGLLMGAMALTIRQRRDHDTDCCPFCHYNGSEEDYCPGWEGEECFQWRGK